MRDLPEAVASALAPLRAQFPPETSMGRLVVTGQPPADVAGCVETALEDEALAAPVLQAALWLYADDLDRSHRICQQIEDATGSFWHGIMHRREGGLRQQPLLVRQGRRPPGDFADRVRSPGFHQRRRTAA